MQCGKKCVLGTLLFVSLATTLVVVFFVHAFPSDWKLPDWKFDFGNGNNATSLRGATNDTTNDTKAIIDEIEDAIDDPDSIMKNKTEGIFNETLGVNETGVEDEGAYYVAKNETLSPSNLATRANYNDYSWDDLPNDVKDAAAELGWDKVSWDHDSDTSSVQKRWSDLNRKEKKAARMIGFTKHFWNNKVFHTDSTFYPSSEGSTFPFYWAQFSWEELPEDVRSAADYLGYTESSWNEADFLPLLETKWKFLTDTQRSAAESLGFNQELWDDST